MNRQVPLKSNKYLLVGSGCLAKHLSHYFHLLNLAFYKWSRDNSESFNTYKDIENPKQRLNKCLDGVTHILVAISDSELNEFCSQLPKDKTVIHFSGTLSVAGVYSAHPLMTFSQNLYELEDYKKINFIIEKNSNSYGLRNLLPFLSNPSYIIDPVKKPLYHSLCVFGGNFTNILWREVAKNLQSETGIPFLALHPYIQATFNNIITNPLDSLTGPLKRSDNETIKSNTQALKDLKLDKLYQEFVEVQKNHTQEVNLL